MNMNKKTWTTKGEMLPPDRDVIRSISEKNPIAARIFVTGEVAEDYIGEAASRLLISVNNVYYEEGAGCEPLFTETRNHTIRMTRFEPVSVWGSINPDLLVKLINDEAERLGVPVDPYTIDNFDFYQEMVLSLVKKMGIIIPAALKSAYIDDYYNAVYLSCLLLLNKQGYLDVPVSEYFAQPEVAKWMKTIDYRELNMVERNKLNDLIDKYGNIQALTNPELDFIVSFYARR
jgi:hypothetical protein